jgi:predicted O-methyltransferase YrrM
MEFKQVADAIEGVPFIDRWHGRALYDHVRQSGARDVLELGTAHGASVSYLAAAVAANGGGTVTTVDRYHFQSPSPEETLARAGLLDAVTLVRIEHSSYSWWLKNEVQAHSDAAGNCEGRYDFCLLDGSHDWHIDGLSVLLVERLLRDGAWLALDDLDWSYERSAVERPPNLSAEEITVPHVQEIFDVLLRPHPAFTQFRVDHGTWGWAQKAPGAPRRLTIEAERVERGILAQRAVRAGRRAQAAVRRRTTRRSAVR